MVLDYSQNGIYAVFEITEDKTVALRHFLNKKEGEKEKNLKWCSVADVHISGGNPNDHHGGKHTGVSSLETLKYAEHKYYENGDGNKLEFYLTDGKIEVVVNYQFYKGISAVRVWTVVKNISDSPVGLEYVSSFSYTGLENNNPKIYMPHNAWVREVNWKEYSLSDLGFDRNSKFSSKRISASNTGTWSTKEYLPMAVYEDTGSALMWQIENNGSWQWEISDIDDMLYLKVSGPTEQENQWYKELMPNESFESVKMSVAVGEDFDNTLCEMTKYRRKICKTNEQNSKFPVIFNDYMHCLWADPTTEKMIPVIDKACEAGAEYYCMDAGWYADGTWWETVGEWQPIDRRFPGGIKEVFDYIKSKGMVPGIWLEIEVMGINCPILSQFDDECFFMRHGKKVIDHGRYQLDFRNEKVRAFATSVVDRVVKEYGVGYIKTDYNIDAGAGTEVDADSFGDGLLSHNRAYLKWVEEITEKYPDLIIENCSSGGMRMDYALLSKKHIQSVSDQEDYVHTAYIAAAAPTAVIPEQSAIWSYPLKDSDENATVFNMVGPMLQRMHLAGDIVNLTEENFALVKEGIECYKAIREDINDSLAFYPLGIPKYGDGWLCLGFKGKNRTRIAVWRLNGEEKTIEIPLKFSCDTPKVCYPCKNKCSIEKTEKGISVTLLDKLSAVIIEL